MSNGPKAFFNQTDLKHVQTTRYLGQKTFRLESSRSKYTAPLKPHLGQNLKLPKFTRARPKIHKPNNHTIVKVIYFPCHVRPKPHILAKITYWLKIKYYKLEFALKIVQSLICTNL